MIAIPNERLRERAREKVMGLELAVTQTAFADSRADLEEELDLARIALASLEAEAVAFVMADDLKDSSIISTPAYRDLGEAMERTVGDVVALYTTPPAPVSLPDESAIELLATDLMKRIDKITGERHSVATLSSLRVSIVEACRAAMLQGEGEPAAILKPAIFIDGNISPDDADKLADAFSKLISERREPQRMIAEPVSQRDELTDAVNGLLAVMDEYPETLVPINRDSAVVRQLRVAAGD